LRTVKHPLKCTLQVVESKRICERATDTQSVGNRCEKKNLRNLKKDVDKKNKYLLYMQV